MPIETRTARSAGLRIEERAAADGAPPARRIVGHAATFDREAVLWDDRYDKITEVCRRGCFARAIREGQDVRALFNHDSNFVLGRTRSNTLRIEEDDAGLRMSCDPPDTPTIRDLVIAPIERGDVDGMSFSFAPALADAVRTTENKDGTVLVDRGGDRLAIRWEGDKRIIYRELIDLDLYDVSPATFPAYEGTDLSTRSAVVEVRSLLEQLGVGRKAPAPMRDELRRWLDSFAASAK